MPDAHQPTTKQDLLDLEERLTERMRDMQTEVLHAFHNWDGPTDIMLRSHEERITLLEDRLMQLERGDTIH
ncbi:MAG: hypothetical protein EXQ47_09680 [Bryobacterales bacterium]|nr:hypothetical protein [Bryobacterales bacterium]